jgi:hypothetical protein
MCCTTVTIYNISPEEHGSWTYLCWIVLYWRGNLSTTLAFPDMSVQTKLNRILHSPDEITKTENLKGSYSNSSRVKGWNRTFLSMQFLNSFNSVLHLWYSVLQILNKICILHVRIMYTNVKYIRKQNALQNNSPNMPAYCHKQKQTISLSFHRFSSKIYENL